MTYQAIEIPDAPATLTFDVEVQTSNQTSIGGLKVEFDHEDTDFDKKGAELPTSYGLQTVDVSEFAGAGIKTLEFLYLCEETFGKSQCPIINLDNVSLLTGTPDPLPPPVTPNPPSNSGQTPASSPPKSLKCKKGFRKKKVKGKTRCVRKHRKRKGRK